MITLGLLFLLKPRPLIVCGLTIQDDPAILEEEEEEVITVHHLTLQSPEDGRWMRKHIQDVITKNIRALPHIIIIFDHDRNIIIENNILLLFFIIKELCCLGNYNYYNDVFIILGIFL